jgi:hypothetical protein
MGGALTMRGPGSGTGADARGSQGRWGTAGAALRSRTGAKKYGLQPTDFFWSSHENQATRRSYLMNELKNNSRDLDYDLLKVNVDEYKRIKTEVAHSKNANANANSR